MAIGFGDLPSLLMAIFISGMVFPAVMLIILGYIDCTKTGIAILLLVLGVSLTGTQYSGWVVNHMDIAPAFAGILFGISNSVAAVTGFLSPVVVGVITKVGAERSVSIFLRVYNFYL